MKSCELSSCINSEDCIGLEPRSISGKLQRVSTFCRHYACSEGERSARRALSESLENDEWQQFIVIGLLGEEEEKNACSFETSEKPFNRRVGRIVTEEGSIFSKNSEGEFYATGQKVLVWKL